VSGDDAELRLDALTRQWVVVAGHRQDRPNLPAGDCPFCVGGLEAPEAYQARAFPNRWPVLTPGPALDEATGVDALPARGAAEVIVYSPDHDASLASIGVAGARAVVEVWADRTAALLARPEIAYVLVFENRGAEVGATIDHPHGQLYGFPFVPPVPAREADVAARHGCAVCAELRREAAAEPSRMVVERPGWRAWVPYASGWPFGLLLAPQAHVGTLPNLTSEGRSGLAAALVDALGRYDRMFDAPFPYLLWVHQAPGLHLHVHLASPRRAPDALRYVAAGEVGSGTLFNPVTPERAAQQLRGAASR
jgi:UDPglucose--hexose-1-phosphate uridylyltransferase